MKRLKYVIFASVLAVFASVEAPATVGDPVVDQIFSFSKDQRTVDIESKPLVPIQVARSKTVTKVKVKKDGTMVIKEKTKYNDGDGNRGSTKTKTTIPPAVVADPACDEPGVNC